MTEYKKTDVLLSAENLGISFHTENGKKTILKDINFQVKDIVRPGVTQGQVISLVGRSGMGKTLLIRMLSGLPIHNAIREGNVRVNIDQTIVKAGDMGIVPQDYYMPEHLHIKSMLKLAAKKNPDFKGDNKIIDQAIAEYAAAFEIEAHIDKYSKQLSGGQRQRASIALQLLNGSNFLLMDEPFSGLDPLMIDKTTELLLRVSQSSELKTIIIVSHDLSNCVAISDTVFVVSKQGRTEEQGATLVEEIDLIERGLVWNRDVKQLPGFVDTIREIKSLL